MEPPMIAVILVPLCIAGLMACIWVMLWVQKKYSDAILDEQRAGYAHLRSLIAELEERIGINQDTDVDDDDSEVELTAVTVPDLEQWHGPRMETRE
jgi:hypothetical protein